MADAESLYFRHISPAELPEVNGERRLSSQCFRDPKLSLHHAGHFTPQVSFQKHEQDPTKPKGSIAVISQNEAEKVNAEISTQNPDFPGHATLIHEAEISKGELRARAKQLCEAAEKRGIIMQEPEASLFFPATQTQEPFDISVPYTENAPQPAP